MSTQQLLHTLDLFMTMDTLSTLVRRYVEELSSALESVGLTAVQLNMLHRIKIEGQLNQTIIVQEMGVTPVSIDKQIKAFLGAGLVDSTPNHKNRRENTLRLTSTRAELYAHANLLATELTSVYSSRLTVSELETLQSLLAKLK